MRSQPPQSKQSAICAVLVQFSGLRNVLGNHIILNAEFIMYVPNLGGERLGMLSDLLICPHRY